MHIVFAYNLKCAQWAQKKVLNNGHLDFQCFYHKTPKFEKLSNNNDKTKN